MSTIKTYALLEGGTVINVILWDGAADWTHPVGVTPYVLPAGSEAGIGWTTADGVNFTAPAASGSPE
jgi:hypothetical protein